MSIDFKLRDFFAPRTLLRLHRTLEKTQWLPSDELQGYQEERLREVIEHAHSKVPYYRNLFRELGLTPSDLRTVEDLERLPLLTKKAVRSNRSSLMADDIDRYGPKEYATSGTSAEPLHFFLDRTSNALEFVYYWRYWGWSGYRLGDRFAEFGSHFFLERPNVFDRPFCYQPYLRRLHLNSARVSPLGVKRMVEAIRRFRPKFLKGVSSTLYFFALNLKEANITDLSFKAVFSTGEVVTRLYRKTIEEVLNAPLMDSYGHMERTVSISQCPAGGYHVNSDYGVLEITGKEASKNGIGQAGRAVGTSLYNYAMPLIRYDIGDEIETFSEPQSCSCGRTLPLVKAIHGRSEDVVVTPDERFVTSLFIVPEFVQGIRFAQFVQVARDEMEIRIVPSSEWDRDSEEQLLQYTSRLTGDSMKLRLHQTSRAGLIQDHSGKIRSVIGWKG